MSDTTTYKRFLDEDGLTALWEKICSVFPSNDGQGATGDWAINITGNANSASSVDWSGVQNKPEAFTPTTHEHDDRYYTKTEITAMCMGLEDTGEEIDDVDVILQAQITQYVTNVVTTSVVDEINSDK